MSSAASVTPYLVIFGAAVKADGAPSGSLIRRVQAALAFGRDRRDVVYLPTGGIGRYGAAEAHVMRDLLLVEGISAEAILLEDQARDTLQSVRLCHRLLRARSSPLAVVVCTSGYHAPRCALLFGLLGYRVRIVRSVGDRQAVGLRKWLGYVAKEALALPYDGLILLITTLGHKLSRRLD